MEEHGVALIQPGKAAFSPPTQTIFVTQAVFLVILFTGTGEVKPIVTTLEQGLAQIRDPAETIIAKLMENVHLLAMMELMQEGCFTIGEVVYLPLKLLDIFAARLLPVKMVLVIGWVTHNRLIQLVFQAFVFLAIQDFICLIMAIMQFALKRRVVVLMELEL